MRAGLALILLGLALSPPTAVLGRVQVERVPGGGIQPQAIVDASGVTHLIYFAGSESAGDLFYVRRAPNGLYSPPLRVNSEPGTAVATGTVRGVQLALGRGNRLHVIWNGAPTATPRLEGGLPLFYTRLSSTAGTFEPQRNVLTWSGSVDGGGTLAADDAGRVFVAWHANAGSRGDARRAVYLAASADDGATFARERRVSPEALGACACCSMRALIDRAGSLLMLFRAAGADVHRDVTLLASSDRGQTFTAAQLHPWRIGACPMSTMALAEGPRGVIAAWDTAGQVFMQHDLAPPTAAAPAGVPRAIPAPGAAAARKHPVLAINARGETLLAWLEGTAWRRGGTLAWQRYTPDGRPDGSRGAAPDVPVWGLATAAALPDGRFLLLY